ncbi:MAG TPA: glycoside hydrolase family 3 N-terminal domain-containing protein [Bacteroidales bacterium]|nr:glycoside hydrolase family 3 N-terminal domain-containing protein [Bacteroidales bacterium]
MRTTSVSSLCLIFSFFLFPYLSIAQDFSLSNQQRWVDSVYNSLSIDERIAQLMMLRANQPNQPYDSRIDEYIRTYNIGGVAFFKNKAEDQLRQTNRWQQIAKTPLLVAIDAEWGLAMRLDGTPSYPFQMTLGAIADDELIREMGRQIAEQLRRMGIHMSFAPVADVNNNPANPVIGMRSFGDSPEMVARKALAYATGLQQGGIITTAKHFPGHGNTQNDSHFTLPVINASRESLDKTELLPFKYLIDNNVQGIMTAHLHIPSLDATPKLPSSLSGKIITELLRNELGFKGLIVTDGLDMKGVTSVQPSGTIELMALEAGNDILLLPENLPLAISTIRQAISSGRLPESVLEDRCKRVLTYKYMAGLNAWRPSFTEGLRADLNKDEYKQLVAKLFAKSITLLRNSNNTLPLNSGNQKIASLALGQVSASPVDKQLRSNGWKVTSLHLGKESTPQDRASMLERLSGFDLLIINIHNTNILANRQFGITAESIAFVKQAAAKVPVVLNIFASPYALDLFEPDENIRAIIIGYQDREDAHTAAANVLCGLISPEGRIPVNLSKAGYEAGFGLQLSHAPDKNPLKDQSLPSEPPKMAAKEIPAGFARQIDSVIEDGIRRKAFPGCQVVAMKDGEIIFKRSYGKLTYEGNEAVTDSTIYDLASLTKVVATTLAFMKLTEDGHISLADTLGTHFPWLRKTDKARISWMDILTHQSGFDGWIPFYTRTIGRNGPDSNIYSKTMSDDYPWHVADSMFMHRSWRNHLFDEIVASRLKSKEYRYSDLGLYFVPDLIRLLLNKDMDIWLEETFYKPMNLNTLTYNPLRKFDPSRIAPTESDKNFRRQVLRGYVHDQGAAMMGGVSGHAGMFGNATDVAKLMQMMLDGGSFNGIKYLKPETILYFNQAHFSHRQNRRGIGFDKPPLNEKGGPRSMAASASMKSFGHTGFTGTMAWADPENRLVFVFLSNRVYPDASDNQLAKLGIRPKVHEILYQALANQTASAD